MNSKVIVLDMFPNAEPPKVKEENVHQILNKKTSALGISYLKAYLMSRALKNKTVLNISNELKAFIDQLQKDSVYFISDLGFEFNEAVSLNNVSATVKEAATNEQLKLYKVFESAELLNLKTFPSAKQLSEAVMNAYPNVDLTFWINAGNIDLNKRDLISSLLAAYLRNLMRISWDIVSHPMLLYGLVKKRGK